MRSESGVVFLHQQDVDGVPARVSILGGPLQELGRRLGLVRGASNTHLLGFAAGWSLWLLIVLIAAVRGVLNDLFVLPLAAAHARLLLVIPMFFMCEWKFDIWVGMFLRDLTQSDVIPGGERPKLTAAIDRFSRNVNSALPDILCFTLAVLSTVAGARVPRQAGDTSATFHDPVVAAAYFFIAGTAFRFFLFRWLWRLGLWFRLLWRISTLKLHLFVGHSDGAGGIGGLEGVHKKLGPLFGAFAVLVSAMCAEELSRGMPFQSIYPIIAVAFAANAILAFAPMFFFAETMRISKARGYFAYMSLATQYLAGFEARWLSDQTPDKELLGADDLQSLADLTNSINVARGMKVIPAGASLLKSIAMATLLPMLPLLFFRYSVNDLLLKFAAKVLGV